MHVPNPVRSVPCFAAYPLGEGIYSSQLAAWRRLRARGQLQALSPQQRGPKSTTTPVDDELATLRRENARLQTQLARAETIIEVQKKVSQLLGIPTPETLSD